MKSKPIRRPLTSSSLTIAGKLLRIGHILILLALCEFSARMATGSPEHLLYIESFMSSLSAAFALLWGAGLGLEYLEQIHKAS